MKKRGQNQDNCSWPSRGGILQSSKTKAASSEELMHDTMDWFKSLQSNRYKTFFPKIYFIHSTLKLLDMQRKKKDLELFKKILALRSHENLVSECGKKSESF